MKSLFTGASLAVLVLAAQPAAAQEAEAAGYERYGATYYAGAQARW